MRLKNKISDILGSQVLFVSDNKQKITKERWKAILQCKEDFFNNKIDDPRGNPYMDNDVAASWVRSRKMGVNPHEVVTTPNFTTEKFVKILKKHQLLIDITSAQIKPFKDQILSCGYLLYLFDRTGLVLLNEGNWVKYPFLPKPASRAGIVADEHAEGTTAHELCFRLKRPIQLLGPEHYCAAFQNRIASAAPILEENGEVGAAMVILSPPLVDPLGDDNLNFLYMHTLGLITSLAVSVETQLKLVRTTSDLIGAKEKADSLYNDLQVAKDKMVSVHKTLAASWMFIDEGMVAVDNSGKIIQINQEAIRILKVKPEEIGNRNINEFFGDDSNILKMAAQGKTFTSEECIKIGNDRQKLYQMSVRPVLNQYDKNVEAVVLKFIAYEKLTTQLNNRSGGIANFTFSDIVGESKEIKNTIALSQRFAGSPENVLLIGESGTGKELFAQAIHNAYRPRGPFMAVNCAALPRELVGSELFGYEGGSFTGAERCGKIGKIEMAHGGTLFLDEIGDMPLELQAVLLRTLQDKQVMRVGGSRYKEVDFRLVAATNKDLYRMVKERQFREDLYYRISVLTVDIPPLRERGGDAEILSKVFVENYCAKQGWKAPQISPETQKIINEYHWPGNVRQLQNAIHHSVNTVNGNVIKPKNLPHYILMDSSPVKVDDISNFGGSENETFCLKKIEKAAIEAALLRSNNCIPTAAEMVGLSRSTLYRKLKEYKIMVA